MNLITKNYVCLVPAYGRDYKSKKEVQEAFDAQKDFLLQDMQLGFDVPVNKQQFAKGVSVNIRFKRLQNVAVLKV